jgi:hypothetical protein
LHAIQAGGNPIMKNSDTDHRKFEKNGLFVKLQKRWGVSSLLQVMLILIAFSLAGMSVVVLRKSFFSWLGFTEQTNNWIKTTTYILFIFPAYQVLLLIYGTLLGQFSFFWEKEKKMLAWIGQLFKKILGS